MSLKRVISVEAPAAKHHWVGDGFPVRTMFDYNGKGKAFNPFIALDYAWPYKFEPHFKPRGVGLHPHRGFETVTFAYEGEVSHKDSAGGGGTIKTGDVQWMTAGNGVLHEEFHSQEFTDKGGDFEMIQLWVNLPSKDKRVKPEYQEVTDAKIPRVPVGPDSYVRVVAGSYDGTKGPATTHTPMDVLDAVVKKGITTKFTLPTGWVTGMQVRYGELKVSGKTLHKGEFVGFSADEPTLEVEATEDSAFLLLSGEPIKEPVVGYGPFVMNTQHEIIESIMEFEKGAFGNL